MSRDTLLRSEGRLGPWWGGFEGERADGRPPPTHAGSISTGESPAGSADPQGSLGRVPTRRPRHCRPQSPQLKQAQGPGRLRGRRARVEGTPLQGITAPHYPPGLAPRKLLESCPNPALGSQGGWATTRQEQDERPQGVARSPAPNNASRRK